MAELIYARKNEEAPDLNYILDVSFSSLTTHRDSLEARDFIYAIVNNLLKNNLFIFDGNVIRFRFLVPEVYGEKVVRTALDRLCKDNSVAHKHKYDVPSGMPDFWSYMLLWDTPYNIEVEITGNVQPTIFNSRK